MAENRNIKKQVEMIDKQEKSLSKIRETMKSKCTHTDKNGDLDIVQAKNRQKGEFKYICRRCRKELDLSKIPEDVLTSALDIVDRACDVIKLSLDTDREDDQDILKNVSKTQYRCRNDIKKLYAASLQKNQKGGKRKDRRNNENSSWGNPKLNGR